MGSFGSDGGAVFLADMMSIDRVVDGLEQNKRDAKLHYVQVVQQTRFNDLVRQYNELLKQHEDRRLRFNAVIAQQDDVIADLQRAKADLERQAEQQRLKLEDVTTELAVLRQIDREQNPDAYGYR